MPKPSQVTEVLVEMDSQLGPDLPLLDMRMMLPLPVAVGTLKVNKVGMSKREEKVGSNRCQYRMWQQVDPCIRE